MNIKRFYNSAGTYATTLRAKTDLSADRVVTFPDAAGELTINTATQTLTNKTLTSPTITTPTVTGPTVTGLVTPVTMTALVTTPVGTVSVTDYGAGYQVTTVLTLTDFIVGALAGAGAALGVGNIVCAFPAGVHALVTSYFSLSLKCAGTAVDTDTGLGSVIATGAVNVLSGTATFEDRLTGQTVPTAVGGGAATVGFALPTAGAFTGIGMNTAASVKNVFLNSAGTWNANNTGNLTATGTIVLTWLKIV